MKEHDLKPDEGSKKRRKRLARGNAGRGGTYAGRGRKGQGARSGESRRPYFEGGQLPFVRRLPFKRGFNRLRRVEYVAINVSDLEERFDSDALVTPDSLTAVGLLRSAKEAYKILAGGDLSKTLTVHAPRFSASAKKSIEAAGGTVVEIEDDYERPGLARPHPRY